MATLSEIKDRIVTLCGQVSGIVTALDDYPEDNEPFVASELPAIVVRVGPATYAAQSAHRLMVTRQFQLILHVAHIGDDVQDPDTDALEAVEPYLARIATYFGQHPRLHLPGTDNGLVVRSAMGGDGGIGGFNINSARYMGSTLTLTTEYLLST